jgi:hypothetical protein
MERYSIGLKIKSRLLVLTKNPLKSTKGIISKGTRLIARVRLGIRMEISIP